MRKLLFQLALMVQVFTACNAQIKNIATETVPIQGNCAMCAGTIEKAGSVKNVSLVNWDKDTKTAILTYDTLKTDRDEILKRIALAGYDSDQFLAPDEAYQNLPACCQYERVNKRAAMPMEGSEEARPAKPAMNNQEKANPLADVFAAYFAVKDALVQTDGGLAAAKSSELAKAIDAVQMEKLPMDVHLVWMKKWTDLKQDANAMAKSKAIETQRSHFVNLSKNMYELIKVGKYETAVYYQFCPMANDGKGANWLSTENVVKNPYYGSQMLSCGRVVETIEKQ